jgi:hypothetical protein
MNNTVNQIRSSAVGQSLAGKYKVSILDKNDNVVWEQKDWAKNLILNQGMEALAPGSLPTHGVSFANVFGVSCMGDGARYNSIQVGYVATEGSASCAGSTVTFFPGASGLTNLTASAGNGYAAALAVGDMIKFNSGTEVRVLSLGAGNTAGVTPTATISPAEPFTIWKTSQAGLQSVLHYAGSSRYYAGTNYCGTTTVVPVISERRTWDFAYETSSVTVREVGVGWASNGNNNLAIDGTGGGGTTNQSCVFSRVLLPTTTSLTSGQKLRLIYELDITISPAVTTGSVTNIGFGLPFTASIGGSNPWPVSPSGSTVISSSSGYYNTQTYNISGPDTNGNTQTLSGYMDPCNNVVLFWSDSAALLLASGTSLSRATTYDTITATSDPYTTLSWTCTKTGVFAATAGSFNIRSFGIQNNGSGAPGNPCFVCLFFQPQQKTTVQTLSLTFQYAWGRTLA